MGNATLIPEHLWFLGRGTVWSPRFDLVAHLAPDLHPIERRAADQLIESFRALDTATQARLRIVLERLNRAKTTQGSADAAIDLRICLEDLFLSDGEQWRIRKRVSERMEATTSFGKTRARNVYKLLSRSVHTGHAPDHPTIRISDIITELRSVVIDILREGAYPAWPAESDEADSQRCECCGTMPEDRA